MGYLRKRKILTKIDMMLQEGIEKQMFLVETFLNEFCKVKGIKETELSDHLCIKTDPMDNTVTVSDLVGNAVFGVKTTLSTEEGTFVPLFKTFGTYLESVEDYPETTKIAENGGERDTETSSGE